MADISQKSIEKQTRLEKGDAQSVLTPYQQKQLKLSQATANKTGKPAPTFTGDDLLRVIADSNRSAGEIALDTTVPIVEAVADTVAYGVGGLGLLATADPTQGMVEMQKANEAMSGSGVYGSPTQQPTQGYLTQNPSGMNRDGSEPVEPEIPTHWSGSDLRKSAQKAVLDTFGAYEDVKSGAKDAVYSDRYKAQEQLFNQQLEALKNTPEYKRASEGQKFLMEAENTGSALWNNPLVAVNTALEAVGDIGTAVAGGVVAKGIGKGIAKGQVEKAEKDVLKKVTEDATKAEANLLELGKNNNTKEFKDKILQASELKDAELDLVKRQFLAKKKSIEDTVGDKVAATLGFTGTTALQEGGSNAAGVIEKIDNMKHEDLLGSDIYAEAYLRTGDKETAKNELKGSVGTDTFIGSGATAAFISTVTGAGSLAANTLAKGTTAEIAGKTALDKTAKALQKTADNTAVKIGTETVEEIGQGLTGEVLSNISLLKADKDTKVFEGLGETAVMSAVGGVGGGSAVHVPKWTGDGVKLTADAIKDTGAKLGEFKASKSFQRASQETKDNIKEVETAVANSTLDPDKEYSRDEILENVINLGDTLDKATATRGNLAFEVTRLKEELDTAKGAEAKELKGQLNQAQKDFNAHTIAVDNLRTQINAINSELKTKAKDVLPKVDELVNTLTSEPESNIQAQEVVKDLEAYMAIDPSAISVEQAEKILASPVGKQLPSLVSKILENVKADRSLTKATTTKGVSEQKIEGGEKHTGIKQYRDGVYRALLNPESSKSLVPLMQAMSNWFDYDSRRVELINRAQAGDKEALKLLKAPKIHSGVADLARAENKLLADSYNALYKLVEEFSPELAKQIASSKVVSESPKQAPEKSSPTQSTNTSRTNDVGVGNVISRISALPEGYSKPKVTGTKKPKSNFVDYRTESGVAIPARGLQIVDASILNPEFKNLTKYPPAEIKNLWNKAVEGDAKATSTLNQLADVIVNSDNPDTRALLKKATDKSKSSSKKSSPKTDTTGLEVPKDILDWAKANPTKGVAKQILKAKTLTQIQIDRMRKNIAKSSGSKSEAKEETTPEPEVTTDEILIGKTDLNSSFVGKVYSSVKGLINSPNQTLTVTYEDFDSLTTILSSVLAALPDARNGLTDANWKESVPKGLQIVYKGAGKVYGAEEIATIIDEELPLKKEITEGNMSLEEMLSKVPYMAPEDVKSIQEYEEDKQTFRDNVLGRFTGETPKGYNDGFKYHETIAQLSETWRKSYETYFSTKGQPLYSVKELTEENVSKLEAEDLASKEHLKEVNQLIKNEGKSPVERNKDTRYKEARERSAQAGQDLKQILPVYKAYQQSKTTEPDVLTIPFKDIPFQAIQNASARLAGQLAGMRVKGATALDGEGLRDLLDTIITRELVESAGAEREVSLSRIIREEISGTSPEVKKAFYTAVRHAIDTLPTKDVTEPETTISNNLIEKEEAEVDPRLQKAATARSQYLTGKNMIKEFFKFNPKSLLNSVEGFFDKALEGTQALMESGGLSEDFFIDKTPEGTITGKWEKEHIKGMQAFKDFREQILKDTELRKSIEADLLKASKSSYKFYAADLLTNEGKLPDNYYDAMILGLYKWMTTEGKGTLFQDDISLKAQLGIDRKSYLDPRARKALQNAGVNGELIVETLGNLITSSLGITPNGKGDKSSASRLSLSVGSVAMRIATSSNIIVEGKSIPLKDIQEWQGIDNESTPEEQQVTYFYMQPENQKAKYLKPATKYASMIDAEVESGRIVGNLLDQDRRSPSVFFSKKAVLSKIPKIMKGTAQKVTQKVQDIVAEHSQRAHKIKLDSYNVFKDMPVDIQRGMYGYTFDLASLPIHKREEAEAQNEAIDRELVQMNDFIKELETKEKGLNTSFYFSHEVWRNQRLGMISNTVNLQRSKLHRHLLGLGSDVVKLNLGETGTKAKQVHKDFLLGVALGFGVSTDKLAEVTSMKQLTDTIQNKETVLPAIVAMQSIQSGNLEGDSLRAAQDIVYEGVQALGEEYHSYEALVNFAKYLTAMENGDSTVEVSLVAETDGVTNGPALGQFLMGGTSTDLGMAKKLLHAAGFKFKSLGLPKSHGEWKQVKGNEDIYEQVNVGVAGVMQTADPRNQALAFFLGSWSPEPGVGYSALNRNFAKETTTGASYGQGEASVKRFAGNWGLNAVLDTLYNKGDSTGFKERTAQLDILIRAHHTDVDNMLRDTLESEEDPKEAQALRDAIKRNVKVANQNLNNIAKLDYNKLFNKEGMDDQLAYTINQAYQATYGVALAGSIGYNFQGLQKVTTLIGAVSTMLYARYKRKLDSAVKAKKEELHKADPSAFNANIDDLSAEQYKEVVQSVQKYLPTFNTAFSRQKEEGIRVGKTINRVAKNAQGQPDNAFVIGASGFQQGHIKEKAEVNPGISAMAAMVHQLDASIMYGVLDIYSVGNIFDAILGNADNINDASKELNHQTFNLLKESNPLGSLIDNLSEDGFDFDLSEELTKKEFDMFVGGVIKTMKGQEPFGNDLSADDLKRLLPNLDDAKKLNVSLISLLSDPKAGKKVKAIIEALAKESPITLVNLLNDSGNLTVKSTLKRKQELIDDLEYVTQYNKEGGGIHIENGEVVGSPESEKDSVDLDQFSKDIEDTLSNPEYYADPEPEVTTPTYDEQLKEANRANLVHALNSVLTNVVRYLDSDSKSKVTEMLNNVDDFAKLQNIYSSITDSKVKKALGYTTYYNQQGTSVSLFDIEVPVAASKNQEVLTAAADGNGVISGKANITAAIEALSINQGKGNRITLNLLTKFILPLVPENVSIQISNLDTEPVLRQKYIDMGDKGKLQLGYLNTALGFFDPDTNTIVLNGTHTPHQGMSIETIAHELIHAAFASIDLNINPTPAMLRARTNLDKLLAQLKDEPEFTEFGSALANRGELLAWGLTNIAFQKALKSKGTRRYWPRFTNIISNFFGITKAKDSAFTQLLEITNEYFSLAVEASQEPSPPWIQAQEATGASKFKAREEIVDRYTSIDLFESLADLDRDTTATQHVNLTEIMKQVSGTLLNPLRVVIEQNKLAHVGATLSDRIILSTRDKTADVPTKGLGNYGFNDISAQEVYVNQLLNVALNDELSGSTRMAKQARKLFTLAKENITPEDLRTSESEPVEFLQHKWNALFEVTSNQEGQINHIREFVAFARSNETMREALDKIEVPKKLGEIEGNTIFTKLVNFVNDILDKVFGRWNHIPSDGSAKEQLDAITAQILKVDDGAKNKILSMPDKVTETATRGIEIVARKSYRALQYAIGSNNKAGKYVNSIGEIFDNRGASLGYATAKITSVLMGKGRLGFVGMAMNEMTGEVSSGVALRNDKFHTMLRKFKYTIDKIGQDQKATVINEMRKAFGYKLTKREAQALSNVAIRADLVSLTRNNGMKLQDLVVIMQSESSLDNEIKTIQNQLRATVINTQTYNYYLNGAEATGHYMITGENIMPNTVGSAERILDMDGMPNAKPERSELALMLIDRLATLHALKTTQPAERDTAARILLKEIGKNPTSNGFTYMLTLHDVIQQEAMKGQFKYNSKDFIKGYAPDTVDQSIEVGMSNNPADPELLAQGFKYIKKLDKDMKDKLTGDRHLYIHKDAGLNKYVQGIAYTNSTGVQGSSLYRDRINQGIGLNAISAVRELADMEADKKSELMSMYYRGKRPSMKGRTYLRPSFDTKGNITDYRYTMPSEIKDQVLNRDNDVSGVMGNLANMNHVIPRVTQANNELIDALDMQLKADTQARNLTGYIRISPESGDKRLREAWNLLPTEAKSYAVKTFGEPAIPIRNDLFDVVMGARKWSIKDIWSQDAQEAKGVAYVASKVLDVMSLNQARWILPKGEKGWQELISKTKDIIVNLSGNVLLANTASNTNYLVSRGITMRDAINDQAEGIEAAKDYLVLSAERDALMIRLKGDFKKSQHTKYAQRIKEIEVLLRDNKARGMIEAGMLTTVVEELDNTADSGASYGAKINNYLDEKLGANSLSRDIVTNVTLSKEAELYKALAAITQFSDFGSRYALIKHTTTRDKNRLTTKEAHSDSVRAFVNYDLPTHQALQYMGDMGLLWFPRYAMRIQRTALHGFADNPARVLFMTTLNLMTAGIIPNIYQSMWGIAANPTDSIGFIDRIVSGLGLHPVVRPF